MMIRIRKVVPLKGYKVRLDFTSGERRTIDLEPYLRGPIFKPLRKNPVLFRTVKVDHELGTIVWENGADIDPDVLVGKAYPHWVEQNKTRTQSSVTERSFAVKDSATAYRAKKRKK